MTSCSRPTFDAEMIGDRERDGCRARIRLYDYGVISIALTSFAVEQSGMRHDLIGHSPCRLEWTV